MDTLKVIICFTSRNYTDLELNNTACKIIDNMTDNEYFKTPTPTLVEVRAIQVSYAASLIKAEKGSPEDTVIKNSWREKLEDALKDLGLYVQLTSKGDSVMISSSGFDVNRKQSTVGPLLKPINVIVKMGPNAGSVYFSCDAIDGARFYLVEYAEVTADGVLNWITLTATKRKVLIEGLKSGKQYVFRIAGAGSDSSRVWSDKITTFVI